MSASVGGSLALFLLLLSRDLSPSFGPLATKMVTLSVSEVQHTSASPDTSPSVSLASLADLNKESVFRRFNERKEHLATMCRKVDMRGKIFTKDFMHYNKAYDLLVCAPPKTGCSSLKHHLLRLAGAPDETDVHSDIARAAISVRYVLNDSFKEVLDSPSTTRVMVVRHPLERLVSGYRDKFRDGAPVTIDIWSNFLTDYRSHRGLDTSNMTLTFHQYLEMIAFLMLTRGRNTIDGHFRPAALVCSPCSVRYDYILHTDTLTQDLQYIADELNITGIDTDLRLNANTNRTKVFPYEYYYRDIPLGLMSKIYALYREDFLMYNFEVPAFMRNVLHNSNMHFLWR
ncbi:carbohydrate sulfotransferase 13-like [Penaeus japonicus]|uniref:carbohydrate sulfotransferase 13-like n=1 Tax=Penaeus japonicus TaxID=27405 RepID=UPI001C70BCCC|nr:carbohydrate sulfotransferase 13-like [Penaeus japonicus]